MANTINVSKSLNVTVAQHFIESVRDDNAFYVFAAKHTPYANNSDAVVPTPLDSVKADIRDIYDDMIFGKRVLPTDIAPLIVRYDYVSNRVYTQYDDTESDLFNKIFYVGVQDGSNYNVYKCLYNNKGANSTVEPTGTDINPVTYPSDGYVWKYMYTASSSMMDKFATDAYIPLTPNTTVVANAVPGSIEVINIEDGGLGYDNYFIGEIETVKVNGNPLRYSINPTASTIENFYNNCLIKMTDGEGIDEYRVITDYYISGGKKVIVINSPWSSNVAATDTFEIYPYVEVYDTGGQKQTNCIARGLVNANTGNSIYKVEILDAGSGYRSANVVIRPDASVGVESNAVLRAIISPPGGHGSNQYAELGSMYAGITTKFIQDEEALTIDNDYRQVGIIKDPLFANLVIRINQSNTVGATSFQVGENIYQYRDYKLAGSVDVISGSAIVSGTGTFFSDALASNDYVLITTGSENIFTKVATVTSNTSLTLAVNSNFTATGATISYINAISYGVMVGNAAGEITVSNVSTAGLSQSLKLVGDESFCTSVVNVAAALPVSINGRNPNSFNTFTQLTKFVGTLTSGSFIEDELVVQDSALSYSQPMARYHSGNSTVMYVTNANNIFDIGEVINGVNSDATFVVSAKYDGELVKDSGQVVYVENLSPITRSETQTETVKLILEF